MGWWERTNRWRDEHPFLLDSAGTAVLTLLAISASGNDTFSVQPGPWGAAWALATVIPLAWRRARPVVSAVAVYTAGLLHTVLGYPFLFPTDLAVLVSLYSVTVYGPRWAHRVAVGGALLGSLLLGAVIVVAAGMYDVAAGLAVALFASVTAVAVWASGLAKRARRETLLAWRDRAERLEVERDQQARIATAAERARIAREMHDIVAHSLSVVVAQADGGRYAAQADPDAAGRALGTIAETGRAALADMRRLLGVLRTDDDAVDADGQHGGDGRHGTAGGAVLVPQPAGQDIERLVETMRDSGMTVSLVRMGTPRTLPPGAGLTAYRICQESLTNVLKHAGPDPSVTVLVQWSPSALVLEVTDDGRGAAATSDGAGHGLTGMHERAAMFGGTVTAGPRPGGGFRVRARLPLPSAG